MYTFPMSQQFTSSERITYAHKKKNMSFKRASSSKLQGCVCVCVCVCVCSKDRTICKPKFLA